MVYARQSMSHRRAGGLLKGLHLLIEPGPEPVLLHFKLVSALKIQPEPVLGSEEPGEPHGGIRRDASLAMDDLVHPPWRHARRPGESPLADAQGL